MAGEVPQTAREYYAQLAGKREEQPLPLPAHERSSEVCEALAAAVETVVPAPELYAELLVWGKAGGASAAELDAYERAVAAHDAETVSSILSAFRDAWTAEHVQ